MKTYSAGNRRRCEFDTIITRSVKVFLEIKIKKNSTFFPEIKGKTSRKFFHKNRSENFMRNFQTHLPRPRERLESHQTLIPHKCVFILRWVFRRSHIKRQSFRIRIKRFMRKQRVSSYTIKPIIIIIRYQRYYSFV